MERETITESLKSALQHTLSSLSAFKTAVFFSIAVVLSVSAFSARAQNFAGEAKTSSPAASSGSATPAVLKAMDAATYAASKGIRNWDMKDGIICGSNRCNPDTEKCVECSSMKRTIFLDTGSQSYFCVNKDRKFLHGQWQFLGSGQEWGCKEVSGSAIGSQIKFFGITLLTTGKQCKNGTDGKKYCLANTSDNLVTINYAESNFEKCEVLPVKLYKTRQCFFCPLVGVVYDAAAAMTDIAFLNLAKVFAVLLALGMGIWIALQVLGHVSSLTKQDAPKFLGNLIKQSYKMLLAFLLLQYSTQIFNYAIEPVVSAGLSFGRAMLTTKEMFADLDRDENGNYLLAARATTGGQHYTKELYGTMEQYVVGLQRELGFMQAVGTSLLCAGSNLVVDWSWSVSKTFKNIQDGFKMMVQGSLLSIFGYMLSVYFVFYLIDAIVQLGVVGALTPFFIMCWPFKATAKYTKTGVEMLFNSAFIFLFVGMIVSINVALINQCLSNNTENNVGGLIEIAKAFDAQQMAVLRSLTDITGIGFLILVFCMLFGFQFMNQGIPLANKFASGTISPSKASGGGAIAPSIATMGTSLARNMAVKATANTREAVGDKVSRGARYVVGAPIRWAKAGIRKLDRGKSGTAATPAKKDGGTPVKAESKANSGTPPKGRPVLNETKANSGTPSKERPVLNETKPQNEQNAAEARSGSDRAQTVSEDSAETSANASAANTPRAASLPKNLRSQANRRNNNPPKGGSRKNRKSRKKGGKK